MSPYAYPSTFTYPTSTSPASSSATSDGSSHSEIKPGRPLYTISHLDVTQLANQPPLTTSAPLITNNNTTRYSPMAVKKNNAQQRIQIAHPYARLVAKKGEVKRRKIWNHALEKSLFTPFELSTMGAPHRRGIYTASLESHIDDLHDQLLEIGFWPVPFEELEPYKGLNSKTAKSMVASLQHDASAAKLKVLELERANRDLEIILKRS